MADAADVPAEPCEVAAFTADELVVRSKVGWVPYEVVVDEVESGFRDDNGRFTARKRAVVVCTRTAALAVVAADARAKEAEGRALVAEKAAREALAKATEAERKAEAAETAQKTALARAETFSAEVEKVRGDNRRLNETIDRLQRRNALLYHHFGAAACDAALKDCP